MTPVELTRRWAAKVARLFLIAATTIPFVFSLQMLGAVTASASTAQASSNFRVISDGIPMDYGIVHNGIPMDY